MFTQKKIVYTCEVFRDICYEIYETVHPKKAFHASISCHWNILNSDDGICEKGK